MTSPIRSLPSFIGKVAMRPKTTIEILFRRLTPNVAKVQSKYLAMQILNGLRRK